MQKIALFLVLFAATAQSAVAAETAASRRAVVQAYFDNLKDGKFGDLMALLDDNIVWHQPGGSALSGIYTGKDAVGRLFGRFMAISNNTFKIDEVSKIMVNGEWVTATLHFSAHRCRYVDFDMSMDGVDLMRVEGGKIKEVFLFSADQDKEDEFWGLGY